MPKIRPRPRAYAFAGVYVLLAVVFAALSHRVVLGLMVAVPLTGVLALNYYLVRSAWARQLGDRSPYGLLTAVFTRDLGRGLQFAESARAGWVSINEGTNYWESHLPFGGRAGSQSGLGRVGGRFAIERLTELKTIVINLG